MINDAALKQFISRKANIDAMLLRLQELSENHFGVMPEDVDYGHAGNLAHYEELLKRITDSAFAEGEHAA